MMSSIALLLSTHTHTHTHTHKKQSTDSTRYSL